MSKKNSSPQPDVVRDDSFTEQFTNPEERRARIIREVAEARRVGALGESQIGRHRPYSVTLADGTVVDFN